MCINRKTDFSKLNETKSIGRVLEKVLQENNILVHSNVIFNSICCFAISL